MKGLFMKYLFLFIRICSDIVLQIKLNIKRNWKCLKRAFKKEPILYKRSKVFRKNFVKYTRLYKGVTEEKKLIELVNDTLRMYKNDDIRMYNFNCITDTIVEVITTCNTYTLLTVHLL